MGSPPFPFPLFSYFFLFSLNLSIKHELKIDIRYGNFKKLSLILYSDIIPNNPSTPL
jgi:hypothetical protein